MSDAADEPFDLVGCLSRVRENDQAAARALVDHLYPLVIRIVRAHLPRRMAEEDIAQDVFLKMFTRLAQFQGAVPFTHWVSRIALTTCIDHLRQQQRRPEFRWADLSENEAQVLDTVLTNEGERAPDDALAARELVHKLLDQLKPEDRLVIESLPMSEIAQDIGLELAKLDPGEVSTALSRSGMRMFLMLCSRDVTGETPPTRAELRERVQNQKLDGLAQGYMAELKAAAIIREP